jgi:hypothetical protein
MPVREQREYLLVAGAEVLAPGHDHGQAHLAVGAEDVVLNVGGQEAKVCKNETPFSKKLPSYIHTYMYPARFDLTYVSMVRGPPNVA